MKTRSRRMFAFIALLLVATMVMSACGGGGGNQEDPAATASPGTGGSTPIASDVPVKDSVILGHAGYIETMDPMKSTGDGNNAIGQIYAFLTRMTADGPPKLDLAESMDVSDDGLTMTFVIKDAKFSNGDPITAEDVVFTLNRCKASSYAGSNYAAVDSFEAVGDKTVVFHMKTADRAMPYILATTHAGILHKATVEKADAEGDTAYFQNPVCSGPYMVGEWVAGEKIVYVANPYYFNADNVAIKTATWIPITDQNTMLIALQSGDVEYAGRYSIAVSSQSAIEADPNLDSTGSATASLMVMGFNTKKAPFDNPKVRQAISYALNKEDIVLMALDGRGAPVETCLPGLMSKYTDGVPTYPYNPDLAKSMLAEAGIPEGFTMSLLVTNAQTKEAEVVQAQLAEVGINVTIDPVESGAQPVILKEGNFDTYFRAVGLTYYDPDGMVVKLYHSTGMFNHAFYSNPELDQLISSSKGIWDDAQVVEAYNQVLKIANTDLPVIPLFYPDIYLSYRKGLNIPYFGPMNLFYVDDWTWEPGVK